MGGTSTAFPSEVRKTPAAPLGGVCRLIWDQRDSHGLLQAWTGGWRTRVPGSAQPARVSHSSGPTAQMWSQHLGFDLACT